MGELSCPLGGKLTSNWSPWSPTNEAKRGKGARLAASQASSGYLETGRLWGVSYTQNLEVYLLFSPVSWGGNPFFDISQGF